MRNLISLFAAGILLAACTETTLAPDLPSGAVEPVAIVEGLIGGPESVRYDAGMDVYFVGSFNDESSGDANGYVSKVSADGEIIKLMFMQGTERWPLHGARGTYIDSQGLWVVDALGVHLFDRRSGKQLDFVDLSAFEPGFPNDIVVAADGALYVTDTGNASLYRIAGRVATLATETPMKANGVTINPANGRLLLAPWEGSDQLIEWDIADKSFTPVGSFDGGGNFDGVEVVDGQIIVASQQDTSLHVMTNGVDRRAIDLPGRPADIGIDTKRRRIAVPYVSLNRVDIFSLDDVL